ncbi:hypothetical protein ACH5RR_016830 [Cinchona calisaya]|uniref:RING-type E3 ubiquitin transferase n=1 Tax=Cinchona calisaya TaxID=153742 RepID=A0ABD2ZX10_9GENT
MENQETQTFHWHYKDFDDSNFQIRGRTLFFVVLLVCLILFVTLIYFYCRWACQGVPRAPLRLFGHAPPPPPPQGLDQSAIGNLPIILHRRPSPTNSNAEAECAICLGIFQEGEKVKVLPDCRHFYHSECVDEWLRTQSSCPLCRASLRVDSTV